MGEILAIFGEAAVCPFTLAALSSQHAIIIITHHQRYNDDSSWKASHRWWNGAAFTFIVSLLVVLLSSSMPVLSFTNPSQQLRRRSYGASEFGASSSQLCQVRLTDEDTRGGTASIPNLTTSLVKSIVGSGVLALPAGVATVGDAPTANVIVPALCIILSIGVINAYFFSLIGKVCHETGASGYREAWELTVGKETSQLVAVVVAFKTALSCLAFSIIVADSFQSLAITAGFEDATRTQVLGIVTLVCVAASVSTEGLDVVGAL